MKKVSVCIPAYSMKGQGTNFLQRNLSSIFVQSVQPYEVIISDHSLDRNLENVAESWKRFLNIKYLRNEQGRGSIAANLNNCIANATGDIIDYMFQDDFYYSPISIQKRIETLGEANWSLTGSIHFNQNKREFYWHLVPAYRPDTYLGVNTIGPPSVLSVKREGAPLFDESLFLLIDCDYFTQLFNKFGPPKITPDITAVSCTWDGQSQRNPLASLEKEKLITKSKYEKS